MAVSDLAFLSVARLSDLLRERQVSPVEVTRAALDRIAQVDSRLNAYLLLMEREALSSARTAEAEIRAGHYKGPLHGVPFALKDLFQTAGVRTTAGSRVLAQFVPDRDATVVSRLREAGAVLLGKLGMHEFAFGVTNVNPHYGATHNPWDTERITGGSSGGSGAALAAGLCAFSLGTDTGGSVRIPAALCGVTGLKPTYGRVSRHGVLPLAWSMDHVGPMARSALDVALVLQAIAGRDPRDDTSSDTPVPDYASAIR
ncbi:MAG: amidase, partial [Chloroflexota bacterium]